MESSRYTEFLSDIRKIDSTGTIKDTIETIDSVSKAISRKRNAVHDLMLSALTAAAAVGLLLILSGLLPEGKYGSGDTDRYTAEWPASENRIMVSEVYAAYIRNIRIKQHITENRKNFQQ